jgi:hypothetical protein
VTVTSATIPDAGTEIVDGYGSDWPDIRIVMGFVLE